MSTRGYLVIRANGVEKATYVHSDGYPSWLGRRAGAEFDELIRDWTKEALFGRFEAMQDVSRIKPTDEDVESWAEFTNNSVGDPEQPWYQLMREAQGSWRPHLERGQYEDAGNWRDPHTWCEFAYVLDLDEFTFTAYDLAERDNAGVPLVIASFDAREPGFAKNVEEWAEAA